MNKNVFFVGLMFFVFSNLCLGCEITNNEKVICLKKTMKLKAEKEFLECWPKEFDDFLSVFGYEEMPDGITKFSPLYDNSFEYVDYYFNLVKKYNGESELYQSLINFSVGAVWQADAVNYYQKELSGVISNDTDTFIQVLDSYSEEKIVKFWSFLFDSFHGKEIDKSICKNKSNSISCKVLANI